MKNGAWPAVIVKWNDVLLTAARIESGHVEIKISSHGTAKLFVLNKAEAATLAKLLIGRTVP